MYWKLLLERAPPTSSILGFPFTNTRPAANPEPNRGAGARSFHESVTESYTLVVATGVKSEILRPAISYNLPATAAPANPRRGVGMARPFDHWFVAGW